MYVPDNTSLHHSKFNTMIMGEQTPTMMWLTVISQCKWAAEGMVIYADLKPRHIIVVAM